MALHGPHFLEWRGERVVLRPGDLVTIGRSPDCTLRLPPEDVHVSRHACEVRVHPDHLEIVNTSAGRRLLVRPPIGPDRALAPLQSTSSRNLPVFSIVVPGGAGAEYEIAARGPAGSRPTRAPVDDHAATHGRTFPLSRTERRLLVALCRPLRERRGLEAVPATYQQIAAETSYEAGSVRNALDRVRDRLVAEGAPGFERPAKGLPVDHRAALAQHALYNGWAEPDEDDR